MNDKYLVIDLETGPQPEAQAERFAPQFSAPGNYKDQVKIDAYIADARKDWLESCALSPLTGTLLAVGVQSESSEITTFTISEFESESTFIDITLRSLDVEIGRGAVIVGFNVRHFDIPFLMRRAWILGVRVPLTVTMAVQKRYSTEIVDLMDVWLCGEREFKGQSLKNIALACGIGEKTGDGAEFARLFTADRFAALEYLKNDVQLTVALAKRLCVVE